MTNSKIDELLKLDDILRQSTIEDITDEYKKNYFKTLQKLNSDNMRSYISSMVKASKTYIQQSTLGTNYYESLSPEMKSLTAAIDKSFDSYEDIAQKYDKDIFRQIIISNFDIDYAEQSALQTADLRNISNATTVKLSNITFNLYNFIKYLSEMQLLAEAVNKQDILSVIVVALWTIANLKQDMTKKIDLDYANFLEFLYQKIGFGGQINEDEIISTYLKNQQGAAHFLNNEDFKKTVINKLKELHVIDIVDGNISIIEKVII